MELRDIIRACPNINDAVPLISVKRPMSMVVIDGKYDGKSSIERKSAKYNLDDFLNDKDGKVFSRSPLVYHAIGLIVSVNRDIGVKIFNRMASDKICRIEKSSEALVKLKQFEKVMGKR